LGVVYHGGDEQINSYSGVGDVFGVTWGECRACECEWEWECECECGRVSVSVGVWV